MKYLQHILLLTVISALFLCSCENEAAVQDEESVPETTVSVIQKNSAETGNTEPYADDADLSDLFQPINESETLLTYTGDVLDGLDYPEISSFADQILIWTTDYSESQVGIITLFLLNPSTGEIAAEKTAVCDCILAPQTLGESLFLCDSGTGLILQMDEMLESVNEWQLDGDYMAWYIGLGGTTLFHVSEENSLLATDLTSGESEFLLENTVDLYMSISNSTGVNLSLVDAETQLAYELWLDFETGEISDPPFDDSFDWVSRRDDLWLTASYRSGAVRYSVGTAEYDGWYTDVDDGSLSLVEGSTYLLWKENDTACLTLYDESGVFISECTLSEDIWYTSGFLWSEAYQGIFFLVYAEDGTSLLFWDVSADDSAGENLNVTPISDDESALAGTAVSAELYERAEILGRSYDVEILIADLCETEYEAFTAEQEYDEALISNGLDVLEESLSAYPDGFFEQLRFDRIRSIQINLTGSLTATDSNWGDGSYNGFTQNDGSKYVMVICLSQLESGTFYHEFSHIIDSKLTWDAYCREDALFSEEGWLALNPCGFEYEYVYDGWWDLSFDGDEWAYFIDLYSMISPTEDRARLMEYALNGQSWMITDYPMIQAKLEYYCDCIRDAFDTNGWPEITAWEGALAG